MKRHFRTAWPEIENFNQNKFELLLTRYTVLTVTYYVDYGPDQATKCYTIHSKSVLTFIVQKIQSQADFGTVEPRVLLWQSSLPLHVKHEVSTTDKLNDKE